MGAVGEPVERPEALHGAAELSREARGVPAVRLADPRASRDVGRVVIRTMPPLGRVLAAVDCVRDVAGRGVPGGIAECGTPSGGCSGLMALPAERHDEERGRVGLGGFEGSPTPTPEGGRLQRAAWPRAATAPSAPQ